jgi:transcriptional regulator with XRE-family HTH domain
MQMRIPDPPPLSRRELLLRVVPMSEHPKGRQAIEAGPVGGTVAKNLLRIRTYRGLTTRQLSGELERIGRPVPASGITRMEKGQRQVTVDELVALAIVLEVSPTLLLLPIDRPETPGDSRGERIPLTKLISAPWETVWRWMHGQRPLKDSSAREIRGFWFTNRPYESDNPEDEAALVMSARVQGAWAPVSDRRSQEERSTEPHGWPGGEE